MQGSEWSGRELGMKIGHSEDPDGVEISGTSRSPAAGASAPAEALRAAKVSQVKAAIASGTFHVCARSVADRMIAGAAQAAEPANGGRGANPQKP